MAFVRERLLDMRNSEAELLHVPGDLGLLGLLMQMLDLKEIAVVKRGASRPPRESSVTERAQPGPRGRLGSKTGSRAASPDPAAASSQGQGLIRKSPSDVSRLSR